MGYSKSDSQTKTVNSGSDYVDFAFDIGFSITKAKQDGLIPYSKLTKVVLTVYGNINTATNTGTMTATFGGSSIGNSVKVGGSASEKSLSGEITSRFNTEGESVGTLKNSSDYLSVRINGPIYIFGAKFDHKSRCTVEYYWEEPHSHSYTSSSSVIVNPTCTTAGTKRKYCSCGAYTDETIPVLGHSYIDIVTPPTCTSQGYTTHSCGGCSHSYVDTYVAAKGHSWVNATCNTPKTCSVCGATEGSALGHTEGEYVKENIIEATCTTEGSYDARVYCATCGRHLYDKKYTTPVLSHNYVATNVVQPSGTSPGYTEYTCSNGCGGSELRDYTNSISVKAGTGCSQITVDGVEPTTEGATRNFVFWQNSVFTLYSYPKTGYVFEKWIIRDANSSVTEDTRQNLPVTLSSNISVEAVYKLVTYTATFLNGDGSTLETVTVTHGSTPVCTKTPTKASTDKYIYTWDNANPWTPAIGALTGNQVYTPNFISKAYFTLSFDYNELASAYDCELVTGQQVGSGLRFTEGSVVKVTAKVKQGYVLSHWEDGSTDNPRLVTITGDIMLAVTITPIPPKFTSVKMLYQNKQISETNKVLANQFFRIVVGVE